MKILKRSYSNKWIAGICGGIGETYRVDPTIVRLVFLFATIASGLVPLAVTYLIAWLIVPAPHGQSVVQAILAKPEPGIPVANERQKEDLPTAKPGQG